MHVQTTRFGSIDVDDDELVTFDDEDTAPIAFARRVAAGGA